MDTDNKIKDNTNNTENCVENNKYKRNKGIKQNFFKFICKYIDNNEILSFPIPVLNNGYKSTAFFIYKTTSVLGQENEYRRYEESAWFEVDDVGRILFYSRTNSKYTENIFNPSHIYSIMNKRRLKIRKENYKSEHIVLEDITARQIYDMYEDVLSFAFNETITLQQRCILTDYISLICSLEDEEILDDYMVLGEEFFLWERRVQVVSEHRYDI